MQAAVITGGGSGLGLALAKVYGKKYDKIILIGRNLKKLQNAKRLLEDEGVSCSIDQVDITDPGQADDFAKRAFHENAIRLLINNAGVGHFGPAETLSPAQVHEMIDTNVKGTIFMSQAFIRHFKEKGAGEILQIISTAGLRGKVNESVYNASKFAVRGYTEGLRKELAAADISIKAAYMGGMDTPFWVNSSHISDKSRLRDPLSIAQQIADQSLETDDILFD
ncbi:SDR family oxidoreductase [Metabacillus sp. GX 13764]|uniref:SDR family NAD(P)-dependent oxidoreductase n=1 Tax=Metabacillus kandeliae TaxID=2900151 RepID=UPI001E33EA45|nr:SDR family oxidoreductase [Metabacillus kandeliae]MCD7036377.1 SDR family oxidoreductase [Metabacillus kandeliae]